MIRSFKHKGLEKFFQEGILKGIKPQHAKKLRLQLAVLNSARALSDTRLPGWRLHALSGNYQGHYSIWVDKNWRLVFKFENHHVEALDYQDYH